MQLLKSIPPKKRRGYALLIILTFLGVALIAFASMMRWVGSNAKITQRNNLFNQSQSAAESATETVIANMAQDFFRQGLNSESYYRQASCLPANQSGWPTTFQFSDTNGNVNASTVTIGALTTNWYGTLPPQFTGLTPYGRFCDIYSRATPQNVGENLTAMIHQQVWFGNIYAFQYLGFYSLADAEFSPGGPMTINGPVHVNKNISAGTYGGVSLLFSGIVGASGLYKEIRDPGSARFIITNNNPSSGAQVISLPIGATNDQATALSFLGIPPPNATNAQSYPYNEADIVVKRDGPNTSVYYQNTGNVQTQVPYDVTNNGTPGYSFVTNVIFYDYREGGTVDAVQLDVGQFGKWLTNSPVARDYQQQNYASKSHYIRGVYVSNPQTIPWWAPGGPTKLPGVRVVNGSQLPSTNGLTVATAQPIYVLGDYNTTTNGTTYSKALGDTTNTYPAALMGDAVTILSSNWKDNYPTGPWVGDGAYWAAVARPAINTTVNAACLEGVGQGWSGGFQNALRLLENWGKDNTATLTYNGSIVVLFESQYATSPWGSYYFICGQRNWGFDLNFLDPSKLPPMTPRFPAFVRTSWSSTQ